MQHLLDWLNNPAVLTLAVMLFGVAVKYAPQLASWPNELIPWLNALLALLVKLGGSSSATHPASFAAAVFMPASAFQDAGFFGSAILAKALDAAWQSVLAALIYDKFGRTVLEGPLGLKAPAAR